MASTHHSFINCATFLDVEAAQEIDQEQGSSVHHILGNIHTYQMEYDPYNPLAMLPQCFVREFGDLIDTNVILRDPNRNEFEVHVIKKCHDMYFDQGWMVLRNVYEIWFGGWLTFTYANPKLLLISVTTRRGTQVKYPSHDPPLKYMLTHVSSNCRPSSSALLRSCNGPVLPRSFVRSYLKKLTAYDVESGILVLPWYGFGESAFAFTYSDLVLVDHTGSRYPCSVKFDVDGQGELACKIFGGWAGLCKRHRLVEGDKVRFAVNEPARNFVMYVCVYPQIGIETTLSYPLNDGSYLPLYVSQYYFVAFS